MIPSGQMSASEVAQHLLALSRDLLRFTDELNAKDIESVELAEDSNLRPPGRRPAPASNGALNLSGSPSKRPNYNTDAERQKHSGQMVCFPFLQIFSEEIRQR